MPQIRMARLWLTLSSLGVVVTVTVMLATVGVAGPAAAASTQAATCSFNGVQNGGLLGEVIPGSTINISCIGLPPVESMVVAQASELGQLLPSDEGIDEIDTSDLLVATSSSTGTLSTTFSVPDTFAAKDPNAQCPPTQAQQNAGLIGCTVNVEELSGPDYGSVIIQYSSETGPLSPTLALSPTSAAPGQTLSISGGPGTGSGGQWWGNFASSQPISDSEVTLGGVAVPLETASVASATYSITISKSGKVTPGPLTAPVLFGTFTLPCVVGINSVSVSEPNTTPLAGTISATTSLTVTSEKTPAVTGLSPDHGPKKGGTSVTISGCKFSHVTAVDFGTTPAKSFHVDNSHMITAVSPAGTGVVNVIVHTASGVNSAYPASEFSYGKVNAAQSAERHFKEVPARRIYPMGS